jgi:hypothetical protein
VTKQAFIRLNKREIESYMRGKGTQYVTAQRQSVDGSSDYEQPLFDASTGIGIPSARTQLWMSVESNER